MSMCSFNLLTKEVEENMISTSKLGKTHMDCAVFGEQTSLDEALTEEEFLRSQYFVIISHT